MNKYLFVSHDIKPKQLNECNFQTFHLGEKLTQYKGLSDDFLLGRIRNKFPYDHTIIGSLLAAKVSTYDLTKCNFFLSGGSVLHMLATCNQMNNRQGICEPNDFNVFYCVKLPTTNTNVIFQHHEYRLDPYSKGMLWEAHCTDQNCPEEACISISTISNLTSCKIGDYEVLRKAEVDAIDGDNRLVEVKLKYHRRHNDKTLMQMLNGCFTSLCYGTEHNTNVSEINEMKKKTIDNILNQYSGRDKLVSRIYKNLKYIEEKMNEKKQAGNDFAYRIIFDSTLSTNNRLSLNEVMLQNDEHPVFTIKLEKNKLEELKLPGLDVIEDVLCNYQTPRS